MFSVCFSQRFDPVVSVIIKGDFSVKNNVIQPTCQYSTTFAIAELVFRLLKFLNCVL